MKNDLVEHMEMLKKSTHNFRFQYNELIMYMLGLMLKKYTVFNK